MYRAIGIQDKPWRRIFWGVVLVLLAAMWGLGAFDPGPDEPRYLFALLAVCAALGSGALLFPKANKRLSHAIGVGVSWLYWLSMAALIGAGVVSFMFGAPIPAAIIVGALIIAASIRQPQ